MKKFLSLLFIAFFFNPITFAESKVYQVELIIFSHFTSEGLTEENWTSLSPKSINFSGAHFVTSLPPQQFVLNKEQLNLDKDPTYQTLLHVAWYQEITNRKNSPVYWFSGKDVQGTIRINIQRYLNTSLNLVFYNPYIGYLQHLENRRMRSNQLNYIDFPLYGVLIKIVPRSTNLK